MWWPEWKRLYLIPVYIQHFEFWPSQGTVIILCWLTLLWWASSLMKEHFRRSPAMSTKVCGRLWLLSRSWAASVRTSCWAAHCRCCEESLEDRQQAAKALASSRGPTAEGLWEGWAYKCAIRPARHGTESDKVARWVREGTKMKVTNRKTKRWPQWTERNKLDEAWVVCSWRLNRHY